MRFGDADIERFDPRIGLARTAYKGRVGCGVGVGVGVGEVDDARADADALTERRARPSGSDTRRIASAHASTSAAR